MGRREDAARALRDASLNHRAASNARAHGRMQEHRRIRPHAWPAPPRTRSTTGPGSIIACLAIGAFSGALSAAGWGLSWPRAALCAMIAIAISACAASIEAMLSADEASRHGRAFHHACVGAFCAIEPGTLEASEAARSLEAFARHWCRSPKDARACEAIAREALARLRQSGSSPSAESARSALALANANLRALAVQEKIVQLSPR